MQDNQTNMSCPKCGAKFEISQSDRTFACAYCGSIIIVQHDEGRLSLKLKENVGRLEDSVHKLSEESEAQALKKAARTDEAIDGLKILDKEKHLSRVNVRIRTSVWILVISLMALISGFGRVKAIGAFSVVAAIFSGLMLFLDLFNNKVIEKDLGS
jgi:DNA-directed RNA polymerase subunit RPC12/RpoP